MSDYRFQDPPKRAAFGPMPEGDYFFIVSEIDEPYRSKAGNLVLPVKLSILPEGVPVFANPWMGTDKHDEPHDQIAEFLICINRAPARGEEPDWQRCVGARGKCRLKLEIAQQGTLAGKEVNKVDYFYTVKELASQPATAKAPARQNVSAGEFERARQAQTRAAGGHAEPEPDDLSY